MWAKRRKGSHRRWIASAGCGDDRNKIVTVRKPKDVAEGKSYRGSGMVAFNADEFLFKSSRGNDRIVESFEPDDIKHSFQTFVLELEIER